MFEWWYFIARKASERPHAIDDFCNENSFIFLIESIGCTDPGGSLLRKDIDGSTDDSVLSVDLVLFTSDPSLGFTLVFEYFSEVDLVEFINDPFFSKCPLESDEVDGVDQTVENSVLKLSDFVASSTEPSFNSFTSLVEVFNNNSDSLLDSFFEFFPSFGSFIPYVNQSIDDLSCQLYNLPCGSHQ